jgi:hypothetical protein
MLGRRNVIEERLGIGGRRLAADIRPSNEQRSDQQLSASKSAVASAPKKERVLIIGGGFAGLLAARGLKVEIVKTSSRSLSSRRSHRCWVRRRTSP